MDRKDIERLYTDKGFDYRPTPQDQTEAEFFDRVTDKPIRHRLDKVVRTKGGRGDKEYILYEETLLTEDKLGNILALPKVQGKYEKPQFSYQWDKDLRKEVATSLVGKKSVYEIPYSRQNMLDVMSINTEEDANTSFVLVAGANARYSGFSADDFVNRTFDELHYAAVNGEYPTPTPTTPAPAPRQQQQQQHEVKEIKKGLVAESEIAEKAFGRGGEGEVATLDKGEEEATTTTTTKKAVPAKRSRQQRSNKEG